MADKIKVSKEECEIYTIRNGCEWGQICIRIAGETVNVMSNTSFGSYSYWWGACGYNPKKFLTNIDMYYAMEKFTSGKLMIPDPDQYAKEIKVLIIESRLEREITSEEARAAWDDLLEILDEYYEGDALYTALVESEWFNKIFGDYEALPTATKIDPQCKGFWDKIWIPFINELKLELNEPARQKEPTM